MRTVPIEKRFWKYIKKTEYCWEWIGSKDRKGYGKLWESQFETRKIKAAHRLSYELHKGSINDHLCVCHKCNNPACVNPDHLYLGTQAENMKDAVDQGRTKKSQQWIDNQKGSNNPASKVTENQVREIRKIMSTQNYRGLQAELCRKYGVNKTTIRYIVCRKTWIHI